MRNLKGFTLIELLIVVAIIAILAAIAVPNFLEAQVRSKVSRVKADHRSLATAIESYYVDNNQYPAHFGGTGSLANAVSANAISNAGAIPVSASRTFALRGTSVLSTLTTPVSFMTSYPPDPFADSRGLPFRYHRDRAGWILGSFGPDTDQGSAGDGDFLWATGTYAIVVGSEDGVETIYKSSTGADNNVLAYTYDSTNGTVSSGDVWRVKE